MWPAIIIASILILGVGVVLVRQKPGSWLRFSQRNRHVSMEAAWQSWLTRGAMHALPDNMHSGPLHTVDDELRESVHTSLLEFEDNLHADAQPMLVVRRELMDSIDRRQLNSEILNLSETTRAHLRRSNPEILQSDAVARTYIFANEMRIAVLRIYAGLRYGDCAEGDWFAVYQKASRLRQRGTRNYIERTVDGRQSANDDVRFQTMSLMDGEIRKRLLQVPPGTRFPGFDPVMEHNGELA